MIVTIPRDLGYHEVDRSLRLKPVCLFELFQEAALAHTEQVGLRTQDLLDRGFAWMMYKTAVTIRSWPRLGIPLRLRTWSTGIKAYQAHREFEIESDGLTAVAASSLWFGVDLEAGRIQRIPEDMAGTYAIEPDTGEAFDLKRWKPASFPGGAAAEAVGIRASDFDPYGHVNNAVYLDYLDTALSRQGRPLAEAGEIRILFRQGIAEGTREIVVATTSAGGGTAFRIAWGETVFAEGWLSL